MALGFAQTPGLDALGSAAGDIINSVFGDVLGTLTGEDSFRLLYKQDETGQTGIKQYNDEAADRSKWSGTTDKSIPEYFFLLKYPYSRFGIDAIGFKGIQSSTIQIPFNVNPQRETITEPHAYTVQYAQGGGKIINSEGMVSKDIQISGSTGVYPGERRARLPDSGIGSGFEGFKFLETVFRRYAFLKRYGDMGNLLQLIYVSRRRQEAWVVEPKTFTSEDAVEHNFNLHYNIQLETLYPYDGSDTKGIAERLLDAIPFYREFDAILQRTSEFVDQLNAAAGQISSIVDSFSSTIMARVIALANTYADVKAGRLPNFVNFKRDAVRSLIEDLRAVHAALEIAGDEKNAKKVADAEREVLKWLFNDKAFEETPNDKADRINNTQKNQVASHTDPDGNIIDSEEAATAGQESVDTGNPYTSPDGTPTIGGAEIPPAATDLLGGDREQPASLPGSDTYAANNAQTDDVAQTTKTNSTVGGGALDIADGDPSKFNVSRPVSEDINPNTLIPPKSARIASQIDWNKSWVETLKNIDTANSDIVTATVKLGDDVRSIAERLLGDSGRWTELVLLNDLKYPYFASQDVIDSEGLTNVIAYGSDILYPKPKSAAAVSSKRVFRKESEQSIALTPFERALGADIKIDSQTRDVIFSTDDLVLAYGIENLEQFIRKRVLLKKGQLRRAARLGFSHIVGQKEVVIEFVKAEARGLFRDDDRISSCEAVDIQIEAQVVVVALLVRVKDLQDPIIVKEKIAI